MLPHMFGVCDRAEPVMHSPSCSPQCGLRTSGTGSALRSRPFRGSIPNLCVLLSTLGLWDYSHQPMTRSQTGWLDLVCSGLSPPTYCRFLPAHLPTGLSCMIHAIPAINCWATFVLSLRGQVHRLVIEKPSTSPWSQDQPFSRAFPVLGSFDPTNAQSGRRSPQSSASESQ